MRAVSRAVLVTIPFSHFCEKARWALDRAGIAYEERQYLPFFHLLGTSLRLRPRATPILIDEGETIADSTAILRAIDARLPAARRLYPEGLSEQVLAWEEKFDRVLGPSVRRVAYHHLTREAPDLFVRTLLERGPRWQRAIARRTPGLFGRMLDRALDLGDAATARSRRKIEATIEEVEPHASRGWLVGERFTAADLTLAALLAPLLAPPEHPFPYVPAEQSPPSLRALAEHVRASAAGALALRAYRDERARRREAS